MTKRLNLEFMKYFLYVVLLVSIIFISYSVLSSNGTYVGNLTKGVNYFSFNYTSNFYASDLFILNPELEVISYYDSFYDKNFSYLNVFGGVGRNFRIYPNVVYEIYSNESIELEVP